MGKHLRRFYHAMVGLTLMVSVMILVAVPAGLAQDVHPLWIVAEFPIFAGLWVALEGFLDRVEPRDG